MDACEPPASKIARQENNFDLCMICQKQTDEDLVKSPSPTSHQRLLDFIKERASYGDADYPEKNRRLHDSTAENLKAIGATWHRSCFQSTCHKKMTSRARENFEKCVLQNTNPRGSSCSSNSSLTMDGSTFTRSKSKKYDSAVCFFCDGKSTRTNPLFKVRHDESGKNLHDAIVKTGNPVLSVKLNTAIDPTDAHAIDIQYHKKCYTKNVTNVIRETQAHDEKQQCAKREVAADVEFVSVVQEALQDGEIIPMANLHDAYQNIREANGVECPACDRRKVKKLLEDAIPDIEFHQAKQRNMSNLVSLKSSRDVIVMEAYDNADIDTNTRTLFEAANILRRAMLNAEKWSFQGSFTDIRDEHVPPELYTFFRWVLQGTSSNVSSGSKDAVVDEKAKSLSQSTMSFHLSNRQVQRTTKVDRENEMPQQVAIGVAIRQATRGKNVINILNKFGVSVSYERLLRLETQIANTVIQRMQDDEVYIPADIVSGRHVFFAVDNIDFNEDTPNGKNTLHGTVTVVYQRRHPQDTATRVELLPLPTHERSVKDPPEVELLQCRMPKSPKPPCPTYTGFQMDERQDGGECKDDLVWLIGQSVKGPVLPCWSGYNSMLSKSLPLTSWHTLPLIAAPAHEWQTLLTVLKQAQNISAKVVGPHRKTVISLDMGLYKPAKQLQMARQDCDHLILRPGELHTVMAQLRTIGTYIDNSGIDLCWTEADLYGTATVKQIIDGKHVHRGIEAHMVSLQALSNLYWDVFSEQYPDVIESCSEKADILFNACESDYHDDVQVAHADFIKAIDSLGICQKMEAFDGNLGPLGKAILNYMQMVLEMAMYIRAVRTANWQLHLYATEVFVKYFFAHDKQNYARLIPLYLADMKQLAESDPDIWAEFEDGNWVVNKNNIPFCSIGADHALEQANRMMKVGGGLVGITQNPSARSKFFLVAPEMSHIASEAWQMAGLKSGGNRKHHKLTNAKSRKKERDVNALTNTIRQFGSPFTDEHDEVTNIVTKAIMPETVQHDINRRNQKGQEMYATFVSERITSSSINFWAPMRKVNLHTWSSNTKSVKVKDGDKLIELREDRALFARLLVVSKAREIDLKHNIGMYEFSVLPRAIFAPDGSLLLTSSKSDLMHILESLPADTNVVDGTDTNTLPEPSLPDDTASTFPDETVLSDMNTNSETVPERRQTVAIVDGMADLQALDKPEWVQTCSQLATHFIDRFWEKYHTYNEVHLVFDRYDIGEISLKATARKKRLAGNKAVAYHITDSTSIAKISMRKLLAHVKTKDQITAYLAEKILQHGAANGNCLVVAWRDKADSCHRTVNLNSSQEEADTKLMLHAVEATNNGAMILNIFSPDTDVLVLAIRRYPNLAADTSMVTGTGVSRRTIKLGPIYNALEPSKAAALPGFHAFSGADITGKFAGKCKKTWWKVFDDLDANHAIILALSELGMTETVSEVASAALEDFVCKVYIPGTKISDVADARWWLFKRKQAQAENLPPTKAALTHVIERAHYQSMIWNSDIIANPEIPSADKYGWNLVDGIYTPVQTHLPPAPDAVTQLVRCGCKQSRCSRQQCKCKGNGLLCTDFCTCSNEEELCENAPNAVEYEQDSDDDDLY